MVTGTSTKPALRQIKPAALREFHQRMAGWYAAHGRHTLPWRKTDDGYAIWLSEVMLQQTQVATVLARFYHPFLAKFPTIESLAAAPREAVMKAWEGLGYYSRAGNLHKAAQQIVADSSGLSSPRKRGSTPSSSEPYREEIPAQGRDDKHVAPPYRRNEAATMPATFEGLIALPGIGRNTAHAILAFAHHQPVAIMEANVKRIVTRIYAWEKPTDQQLWDGAAQLLDAKNPFDHNQAMMDLGSSICTPKKPACALCPANNVCEGKTDPERYPAPKAKKQVPTREVILLVEEDAAGKLRLTQRDERLLGGMYGFPQIAMDKNIPLPLRERLGEGSVAISTDDPTRTTPSPQPSPARGEGEFLGDVVHVYSHFRLEGRVLCKKLLTTMNGPDWHSREAINALPLSGLDHKVLALVDNCNSTPKKRPETKRKRR